MTEEIKLVVTRDFEAPSELVYDAWLDEQNLGRWLFATPDGVMKRVEVDARVDGIFAVAEQRGDVLAEHYGRYVELDRPRRIVFLFSNTKFEDANEKLSRVQIDISKIESGCQLTLTHEMSAEWAGYKDRVVTGWTMVLDGLSSTLFADREYVCSRLLDFPRERVFRAFSDPEQLAKWWGPDGFTNTILKFDFRVGGDWHLTMHGPDGTDYRNESVFVEINEPKRVVYDHLRTMHRFLMDMSYFDFDGKTRLIWRMRFESPEEWERVKAFVPAANEQNFDRLEKHLNCHPEGGSATEGSG